MDRIQKIISIFLICFCISSAYAVDIHKKLNKAIKNAEGNKEFSVSFQQESYSSLRNKTVTSKGTLSVQSPNLFRFEVLDPYQELYVSDGLDFWKYVPNLKHAQHLKAGSAEFDFIKVLTNLGNVEKSYRISEWNPPSSLTLNELAIKLDPIGDKNQKVLYAIVDVKTGFIHELHFVQLNGNRTRFVFTDYVRKQLPKKMFQFTPPSGIVVNDAS
jgi:outer membrane lipoprotein carrier protein